MPAPEEASVALIGGLKRRRDQRIRLPRRGSTSVELLVDELLAETVIHTWDLATGLGRTVEFDGETVAAAHVGLSKLLAESFADQGFPQPGGTTAARGEFERLLVRSGMTITRS